MRLVLHPRHKLEYFKRNNWDESSIEAAHEIIQDEFDRSYWLLDIEDDIATETNRTIAVSYSYSLAIPQSLMTIYTGFCIS